MGRDSGPLVRSEIEIARMRPIAGSPALLPSRTHSKLIIVMSPSAIYELSGLLKKKLLEIAERLWHSVADKTKMKILAEHWQTVSERLADYKAGHVNKLSHQELMRRLKIEPMQSAPNC